MNLAALAINPVEGSRAPAAWIDFSPAFGELVGEPQEARASARLDVVPQQLLQPRAAGGSASFAAALVLTALILHGGVAILFALLLSWRETEPTTEREIPVEIVARVPGQAGPAGAGARPGAPQQPGKGAQDAARSGAGSPSQPPQLVAPPPEPTRAETQAKHNVPANAVAQPPKSAEPDAPPPPPQAPHALASVRGEAAVAQPSTSVSEAASKPSPAETKPQPSSDLAAALPMDFSGLPTSFRAVLSGSGAQTSEEYKGLIFGRLGRASGAVERARAQHLRGQVIVSFAVDDQGRVAELAVAHSSGTPAVDALALDMVREAAPFPPPPPGTTRTFTPALSFGDE